MAACRAKDSRCMATHKAKQLATLKWPHGASPRSHAHIHAAALTPLLLRSERARCYRSSPSQCPGAPIPWPAVYPAADCKQHHAAVLRTDGPRHPDGYVYVLEHSSRPSVGICLPLMHLCSQNLASPRHAGQMHDHALSSRRRLSEAPCLLSTPAV